MSFPRTFFPKRSDESFRLRTQIEHHCEHRSIIEMILGVDMVKDFPTSDPLHLLDIGIMKRCLLRWTEGTKTYRNHFRKNVIDKINLHLMRMRREMPTEIHRSIRDLDCLKFWKGTEFRTFLLYIGIVALEEDLTEEEYEHFKLLICAIIFCSSKAYASIIDRSVLVDTLLSEYFEGYIEIYGEHTITSNVHNISHILDDVRRFGNLNTISTYPFENCLQLIKKRLRSMNNPLQQIERRFAEISNIVESKQVQFQEEKNRANELKFPFKNNATKYQSVMFEDFRLSTRKFGDKFFLDKYNRIIKLSHAVKIDGKIVLHGWEIENKRDFFATPFDSSKINIYVSDGKETHEITCHIEDLKCKLVCLSFKNEYVFQPLLHTLQC